MKHLNLFIELTRLNKPIGFMLLFWPCAWGLTIGYDFSKSINTYIYYLFLFFLGSIFMLKFSGKKYLLNLKKLRTIIRGYISFNITLKLEFSSTTLLGKPLDT